jgi:Domain of unknown function (DUF4442)
MSTVSHPLLLFFLSVLSTSTDFNITSFYTGRIAMSQLIYFIVPYVSTIDPVVENVRVGHVEVSMMQRHGVQNPFASIHLAALSNLADYAGMFAVLSVAQKEKRRAIPVRIDAQFHTKSRGRIVAIADFNASQLDDEDTCVLVRLINEKQVEVCNFSIHLKVN